MVHCNGDATIDMVLDAHKAAGAPAAKRTVIIHSQFVRPDQLDLYVRYGFLVSFFTNHAFFWGDVHVENLGKRAGMVPEPDALCDRAGDPLLEPQRLRRDAAQPDVHSLDIGQPHLAVGAGHRSRRAHHAGSKG